MGKPGLAIIHNTTVIRGLTKLGSSTQYILIRDRVTELTDIGFVFYGTFAGVVAFALAIELTIFRKSGIRPCQALTSVEPPLGTVLMEAVRSKEPAMVKEVGECVRKSIPDQHEVIQISRGHVPRYMIRCGTLSTRVSSGGFFSERMWLRSRVPLLSERGRVNFDKMPHSSRFLHSESYLFVRRWVPYVGSE